MMVSMENNNGANDLEIDHSRRLIVRREILLHCPVIISRASARLDGLLAYLTVHGVEQR